MLALELIPLNCSFQGEQLQCRQNGPREVPHLKDVNSITKLTSCVVVSRVIVNRNWRILPTFTATSLQTTPNHNSNYYWNSKYCYSYWWHDDCNIRSRHSCCFSDYQFIGAGTRCFPGSWGGYNRCSFDIFLTQLCIIWKYTNTYYRYHSNSGTVMKFVCAAKCSLIPPLFYHNIGEYCSW